MTNQNEITQAALVELIAIAADRTGIPPAAADAMDATTSSDILILPIFSSWDIYSLLSAMI